MKTPSIKQLRLICQEWQQRLRLQDWRVRLRYAKEFELDGRQAECRINRSLKSAVIVVNPYCFEGDPEVDNAPMEQRLIHELMHLHLASFDQSIKSNSLEHEMFEQMVDSVAWGLYWAKYNEMPDDFVNCYPEEK